MQKFFEKQECHLTECKSFPAKTGMPFNRMQKLSAKNRNAIQQNTKVFRQSKKPSGGEKTLPEGFLFPV